MLQPSAPVVRQNRYQHPPERDDEPMAKLNHQKRQRPRPAATRRRQTVLRRTEEQRSRRDLERWRRG